MWTDDPATKFDWIELAKFNCILAEARWETEFDAWFHPDGEEKCEDEDGKKMKCQPCDCLWNEHLDCFVGWGVDDDGKEIDPKEVAEDAAGYDKIRAVMGPFLESTNTD